MQQLSDVRIIQPNLTCRYVLTQVPGNLMRSVIAINKDDGVGIADSQIPQVFWTWTLEFSQALKARKDLKESGKNIDVHLYLQLNKSASTLNLTVVSLHQDSPIDDLSLLGAIQQWTGAMAQSMGIELEVPKEHRKSPGLATDVPL